MPPSRRPDPKIARLALAEIKNQLPHSWENIKILVRDGRVILEGKVSRAHERSLATEAVRWVTGVIGLENELVVRRKGAAKKATTAANP